MKTKLFLPIAMVLLNNICSAQTSTAVELNFFTGTVQSGSIIFNWETNSEVNNNLFTIQISSDGRKFSDIHTQYGSGTSNQVHSYSYTQTNATYGKNYYKLCQTTFDGNCIELKTIVINIEDNIDEITVYPNPVGNHFKINLNNKLDGSVQFSLYNTSGIQIMAKSIQQYEQEMMERGNILPGVYYYVIADFNNKLIGKGKVVFN